MVSTFLSKTTSETLVSLVHPQFQLTRSTLLISHGLL
jgi:hypothetical protein